MKLVVCPSVRSSGERSASSRKKHPKHTAHSLGKDYYHYTHTLGKYLTPPTLGEITIFLLGFILSGNPNSRILSTSIVDCVLYS